MAAPYLDDARVGVRTVVSILVFVSGLAFWAGSFVNRATASTEVSTSLIASVRADVDATKKDIAILRETISQDSNQTAVAITKLSGSIDALGRVMEVQFKDLRERMNSVQYGHYRKEAAPR